MTPTEQNSMVHKIPILNGYFKTFRDQIKGQANLEGKQLKILEIISWEHLSMLPLVAGAIAIAAIAGPMQINDPIWQYLLKLVPQVILVIFTAKEMGLLHPEVLVWNKEQSKYIEEKTRKKNLVQLI